MISIIGNGNVATHLYNALKDKTEISIINSRSLETLPQNTDVILICVSDNAISEIVSKLPSSDAIIVHTSGSIPMDILKKYGLEYGVFYPLQTFTKGIDLEYSEIPVFIEGSSERVVEKLKEIASLFSNDIHNADSEMRRKLHLASVFACNFTNALARISQSLIEKSGIDFSVLRPLMKQTIKKLDVISPEEAQTGPAVRGDSIVIDKHLEMLSDHPDLKMLYQQMTKIIQNGKI